MKRIAGRLCAGLTLVAVLWLSLLPPAPLPPIGAFLDPVHGVWTVARTAELPAVAHERIPRLAAPVSVRYDTRSVPHIVAANQLDAIRALGFVVARDRQFQLELQARAGAGTLTALVGAAALPLDRETRRLGLPDAAERRFAALADTAWTRRLLEAYADGVNAWLDASSAKPLEYHLLGRTPARWRPLDAMYFFGRMGWTLAYSDLEELQEFARAAVGAAAADQLFPRNSPLQVPIQPNGLSAPRAMHAPLATAEDIHRAAGTNACAGSCAPAGGDDAIGSNNWAVAPGRTRDGHALLAGDPHLELSLPSIWYEAHLIVPDSLDVYGVTIPGAPGIILGFNRDVAWSFTNAEADVLDRYSEVVDDPLVPTHYRVDGAWRPLRLRLERYLDANAKLIGVDTLRFTHRGPLRRAADSSWQSVRWTVLESGDEFGAISSAARARTVAEWLDRMTGWRAPAQNMVVADRHGTIAIRTTGRFPLRPGDRGDLVQTGDTSASDWLGDWTISQLPQSVNPSQGFLASANQQPTDPAVDPRYLGANWYSPWRALRINELLAADSGVTPDDMRRFQTDPVSAAAERFVPALLAAAARYPARDSLAQAVALLAKWDLRFTRENSGAVLFEESIRQLQSQLWDELGDGPAGTPGLVIAWSLLREPNSRWWDDHHTPVVEDRDQLLANVLVAAYRQTVLTYGAPEAGGWRWDQIRHSNIHHLLGIPALSALDIPMQGGATTLSPSSGRGGFGASWRMVVELGPQVRGWGIYPGGQSGNPSSTRYLDRLPRWRDGELDTLLVPGRLEDLPRGGAVLNLVQ
ncbi:MAG: penicillin acylase family protein [Gemmatimonadales bacterium]